MRPIPPAPTEGNIVKRASILLVVLGLSLTLVAPPITAQDSLRLTGSGATFPFPLYSAWFKSFSGKHKAVTVDYQGKGSGAGVRDFINRTVDFAASDAAMTDEEISKVPGGVQLLPMTGGEIVLALQPARQPQGAEAAARRLRRRSSWARSRSGATPS